MIAAKDRFFKVSLGTGLVKDYERETDILESDEEVLGWMAASLRFEFLSHKELQVVVEKVYRRLLKTELEGVLKDRLALVKFVVRNKTEAFIQQEVDRQTEAAFGKLFDGGRIEFYLECADCRFEVPQEYSLRSPKALNRLAHDDGDPVQKSLFDFVDGESHNDYERVVALCLDKDADVLWWYRNRLGLDHFHIQGYRKAKVYPDFVVQRQPLPKKNHFVLVLESKGEHLTGSEDTDYKRKVAGYFSQAGHRVSWQKLGEDFQDHVFRFEILDESQPSGHDWKDALREMLRA